MKSKEVLIKHICDEQLMFEPRMEDLQIMYMDFQQFDAQHMLLVLKTNEDYTFIYCSPTEDPKQAEVKGNKTFITCNSLQHLSSEFCEILLAQKRLTVLVGFGTCIGSNSILKMLFNAYDE